MRTPFGDGWILAADEGVAARTRVAPIEGARLLPSGDTTPAPGAWIGAAGPHARWRGPTLDVAPGAAPGSFLGDDIAGTWRRADAALNSWSPWRAPSAGERAAVEAEAASLPLPGVAGRMRVTWAG